MHAAAGRRSGLVLARKPFDFFTRAIALDGELATSQVLELDLDCVAGVHRLESSVKCASGDDIAGLSRTKRVSQAI